MTDPSPHAPFFTNQLPEEVRAAVLARVQVRAYRASERICQAGAPAPFISRMSLREELASAALGLFLVCAILFAGLAFAPPMMQVGALQIAVNDKSGSEKKPPKIAQWVAPTEPIQPIPNPKPATLHSVAAGETLSGIAQIHGVTLATLRALNGLDSQVIRVGDQLTVPGDDQPPRLAAAVPTRMPRPPPTAKPVPAQPTATSAPVVLAIPAAPTPLPRLWQMPAWTGVEDANVAPGQKYYRLVKAIYFDEGSAGGRVNILVGVLDENGKELLGVPVKMDWGEEFTTRSTEEKRDPFLIPYNLNVIASHDMAGGSSFAPDRGERGGYKITVEGLPSEAVSGMGLPLRRHVAFLLVYQRTTK